MELGHYLELVHRGQGNLAAAFRDTAAGHVDETEVYYICHKLARQCDEQALALRPFRDRYQPERGDDPQARPSAQFYGPRGPGVGLLRDLQDLYLMVAEGHISLTVLDRAAQGVRDTELQAAVQSCFRQASVQQGWLRTQLGQAAVQALVVA